MSKLFVVLVIWKRFFVWYWFLGILVDIGLLVIDYIVVVLVNKRVLLKDCFVVEGW